jgi:RNA polymerase sigma-70 factor (ECF subfamily)
LAVDDSSLAQLIPRDGATGFAAIVDAHWTGVYRLLYCMTGNVHDAEELTQETFLRAIRRVDSFRPGSQMRSWLFRIASNACRDLRRKQRRSRCVPLADDLAGSGQHPGHRLETAEQGELLRAAIEDLSEATRTVFHLRVEESLSFREIAELVETTEEAARWHMHQARTKLLKRFGGKAD